MNYCQKSIDDNGLGELNFPLLSDFDKYISTCYGVIIEDGSSFRSTFIIDQNLILRHMSINDISICVNPIEICRLVEIFQQNDNDNYANLPIISGCPYQNNAKSYPEIDTFSKYQKNQKCSKKKLLIKKIKNFQITKQSRHQQQQQQQLKHQEKINKKFLIKQLNTI
ncbi:protozoan cyanobacterial globin family protein, putative [Ichthyophthirius multifiliis]|uniref:Protozoan cyanobacterial globin family protein, putative n=1 Tax=Ichthyophthirius multifiliis TaxID=5932 RepID=G0R1U6_ICHMU|nr:protozoan cyanobacterial globin family protein, putative [Ichthyophthirius multifiliis]EGR28555.1 protozoan cyanobacterial globin family protein, putative [Ichthyophthirius multifiliis]|eukprot:XP_004029791.1 protozoan cyanobacterial globin family protein, putative [Ichthyophthirius multifiliis]